MYAWVGDSYVSILVSNFLVSASISAFWRRSPPRAGGAGGIFPSCSAFLRSGCRAAGLWCMWSLESSDVRRPNARDDKLRDKDIFFGPVRGGRLGPAPPARSCGFTYSLQYSILELYLPTAELTLFYRTLSRYASKDGPLALDLP